MDKSIEQLVQHLVDQGKITEEELNQLIQEEKENSPLLPLIEQNKKLEEENEQLKSNNDRLQQEDLNNKEAILELYTFMLGGF